ncbi:unnamed protein product [Echinostoma caproni]|uniref:Rho-GAP domain-containing protein n=1 Tax=Echinostoma caproni TaxID=27848 RepID=A0A183AX70_9TREM|nr:unnamed protein product [Echinostoma caproni]
MEVSMTTPTTTHLTDATNSCPGPPPLVSASVVPSAPVIISSPAPQFPQRTDPGTSDPHTVDRSGLAVRLVRKTKTNFLLSTSKKSRKAKSVLTPQTEKSTPAELRKPNPSHAPDVVVHVSEPSTPLHKEDRKRDKHAKSREKTSTGKSRMENVNSKSKGRSSLRKKSERASKVASVSTSNKDFPHKPVFGVRLSVAYERSPSHDGVPLPAFFRYCIDYVEQYGLSTEGIYRVPGVNSQIQALVTALDKGEDFLQIPPTSPSYYQLLEAMKHPAGSRGTHHTGVQSFDSASKGKGQTHAEPVLTTSLGPVMESVPAETPTVYESLARLVHQQLPRPHRYLLAWLLQHMVHIIDRAGENLMTQANIIIVLSPCLGISHRLLSLLLGPPPSDVHINLSLFDPSLPPADPENAGVDPSTWHWLFPHPAYLLRPYRAPLRPGPDLELPETNEELDLELHKQESLLYHLHEQIGQGDTSAEKEALLWEVQRLVTEIRRRKQLVDPDAIRAELSRQQAQLDRLHRAIAQNSSETSAELTGSGTQTDGSQPAGNVCGSDSAPTHRRRPAGSAKSRAEPVSLYSDELWEVQRQVTMLKRRLKQQEKLANTGSGHTSQQTGVPAIAVPSSNLSVSRSDVLVHPVGGVPLIIPTLSELDEEEVLNLTLRKLPLDIPSSAIPVVLSSVPPCPVPTSPTTTMATTTSVTEVTHSPDIEPDVTEAVKDTLTEVDVSVAPVDGKTVGDQASCAIGSDFSPPSDPPPPPPLPHISEPIEELSLEVCVSQRYLVFSLFMH